MPDRRDPRESKENPANPVRKANGENPAHREAKDCRENPDLRVRKDRRVNEGKREQLSELMLPDRWRTFRSMMMRRRTSVSLTRIPGVFN